jgi:hypothetical protein
MSSMTLLAGDFDGVHVEIVDGRPPVLRLGGREPRPLSVATPIGFTGQTLMLAGWEQRDRGVAEVLVALGDVEHRAPVRHGVWLTAPLRYAPGDRPRLTWLTDRGATVETFTSPPLHAGALSLAWRPYAPVGDA